MVPRDCYDFDVSQAIPDGVPSVGLAVLRCGLSNAPAGLRVTHIPFIIAYLKTGGINKPARSGNDSTRNAEEWQD